MEAQVPKRVGRYVVDRLLGSGAMGYVYLGRDPELDRAVAIKTLRHLELSEDALARFLERFRNEARAAARLHHPSIVQIYDVGQDEATGPYLVFEYVAGSTLKQILQDRGPLPPDVIVQVADQVADALDAAHAEEIIHRDIKPENLLVSPEGQTKLADFGVARVPNAALTREGTFLGTPCYAAPETLREGHYGPQTDLFSFAAVLYEAVSGVRAFPGDDALAVASRVIHDQPTPPSAAARTARVPTAVDAVIMRGLSKDPSARPASATELADELRETYEKAGLLGRQRGAPPIRPDSRRFRTPPREQDQDRGSTLAFVGVLGALMAVGVALVLAFGGSGGAEGSTADGGGLEAPAPDPPHVEIESTQDARVAQEIATDAGSDARALVLQAAPDGAAADADTRSIVEMTPHEREEAAKDALSRARQALRASRLAEARRAVTEARRFDPGNPDIETLQARIEAARR